MALESTGGPSATTHGRLPVAIRPLDAAAGADDRTSEGSRLMTPLEPMLAVVFGLSVMYLLAWWYWWDVLVDEGIELEYTE